MYAVSLPLRQTLNDMNMEIVSIEKKTFEMMVAAFGALSE
ncbi:DNA-binding protein, partial [Parabacteroides merdae]|nr:DNA-binding protein [Parabacteroides merdae]